MGDVRELRPELRAVMGGLGAAIASDEQIAAYEAERELEQRRERVIASGVDEHLPPEMVEAVVRRKLRRTEALVTARDWVTYQRGEKAHGDRPVLALLGNIGRGKTVAAAWLLAAEGGAYIQAEDLCRLQSARFGPERAEYLRLLRLRTLVVDEVGTEEDAERAKATLHDVIDRRMARRTLLLGNVDAKGLRARMDPRTVDRINVCGVLRELAGSSMRGGR